MFCDRGTKEIKCVLFIGVGVNPEIAKKAKEAGASLLIAGAYIFNSQGVKKAIEELGTFE